MAVVLIVGFLGTLGLLGVILVPLQLFVGWAVAALELQVFAYFFPEHFSVANWGAAFFGGAFILAIKHLTRPRSSQSAGSA